MDKVEATILRSNRGMHLVEWKKDGVAQRNWVNSSSIVQGSNGDKRVIVVNPWEGIPYGIDFSNVIKLEFDYDSLNREMRKRGIWTAEDLRSKPTEAQSAIASVYGLSFAALIQQVAIYENMEE